MKKTLGVIGAVSALAFVATAANAETQSFSLSGFSKVHSSAGTTVIVEVGGAYSVRAEGSATALERLKVEVDGDRLEVGRKNKFFGGWGKDGNVTVYVSLPELAGIGASSGSELTATGVDASSFSASVSSGAEATVSGECGDSDVSGSSGAVLDAEDLHCADVDVSVSSGASLKVFASNSVDASASSGGAISVYGTPETKSVSKSSGGSVRIRD